MTHHPVTTTPGPSSWQIPAVAALRHLPGTDAFDTFDTAATPGFTGTRNDARHQLRRRGKHLHDLQEKLYANAVAGQGRSVLLVLQGMDTAGKGGIIRHVLSRVNPEGVDHAPFGVPTAEELAHHFLWRIHKGLPRLGHIGVFDRSHYEDVLVLLVHDTISADDWERRLRDINAFEQQLRDQGTVIVKVAMFVSLAEQKKRLLARLKDPTKAWKYDRSDVEERLRWPRYLDAYKTVLDRTCSDAAPWYLIPCDHKWYSRIAVAELLINALESLHLTWPAPRYDIDQEITRVLRSQTQLGQ